MRVHRFLIPLFLTLVLFTATANAAVRVNWRAETEIGATDEWTVDRLAAISTWHTEIARRPAMPLLPISVVIPAGQRVSGIRLENVVTETLPLMGPLPEFAGIADDHGTPLAIPGDTGALVFPADHVHSSATVHTRGVATGEIALAPLLYERRADGYHLRRLISCEIVVDTEADFTASIPLRQNAENLARAKAQIAKRVANPQSISAFAPSTDMRSNDGLFDPRGLPSIEGSGVDLVIVCSPEHLELFQGLAEFKLTMGIPTVVRDLDWIRQNYPEGADLAETIRFFLQDAYVKWGISDVLIAGDTEIIPVRYVLSHFKDPPETVPTDAYYTCMDGNFNADGDYSFGESGYAGGLGDEADFGVDLNGGRLPIVSADDAQLAIDKIVTYTTNPDSLYTTNVTYLSEVLFPANYDTTFADNQITRNGTEYSEEVFINYQTPLAPQLEERKYYETWWLYPGSFPEHVDIIIPEMNTRSHILFHVGHGFRYTMSCGDGPIVTSDALALENGLDHLFNFYALNCTSCAIDFACLGEAYFMAPLGGSITSIGTSREAYPNTSRFYQNSHFSRLYADSISIGQIFTESKNDWAPLAAVEGSHRWTQYTYILIGDPTINIWMHRPKPLEVALTEPYTFASDSIHFSVMREGVPLEDARVIASKDGEDRAFGTTDASGLLSIPFYAESLGDVDISTISRNNFPYFGSTTIAGAPGVRLSIESLSVVDDVNDDASAVGNADGKLDAGETVRLGMWVHNRGDTAADNLVIDLSLPGGEMTVTESNYTDGQTVAAGDSLELSAVFLLEAPQSLGDGIDVLVDLAMSYDGGTVQSDQLSLACHAPLPELFTFVIDDTAGDNDGEPDDAETYTLLPEWKNYGSTPLGGGWAADLVAVDPNGLVNSGTVALPDLALLERAGGTGFSITESDVSAPNRFELTLSGPLGESLVDTIVVRRPVAPLELILDSSYASTVIDVSWELPPGDSLIAGYIVYRGEADGGPYVQVNSEPTHHAYYRNEGLLESTTYYFVVESIDLDGYRSTLSAQGDIATNPAMQSGWPIATQGSFAGSVAIGDIDGDGDKELVAPSNFLFAWHSDGLEVVDGDSNASTYGVIGSQGEDFASSVALAQVDTATVGLEMVAASQDPYALHVFSGDGSEVAGWPKLLDFWFWASPAVADMDGDGTVEIFAANTNGNFYGWHSDGTEVIDGDNNAGTDGIFSTAISAWTRSSAALANLDADPELEIVVGCREGHSLFAWNLDGTDLPGFPIDYGRSNNPGIIYPVHSSPSIGDVDDDGDNEIVFLCENDSLYVINADGTNHPGFPVKVESNAAGLAPSPALCDFEDDGQLEIVAVGSINYYEMFIHVLDNAGNELPGWPIHIEDSTEGSPVVADLDNDDELEILIGTEERLFYGFELDGSSIPGFPILTGAEVRSTPTIDDIDDDFDIEIALLGWDTVVYIWDIPHFYQNGMAQWKMFRANPARTGLFTREDQVISVDGEGDAPASPDGRLFANYPNPFNPSTRIRFATPAGSGKTPVKLSIHDVRGRLVNTLHQGDLAAGTIHSFVWDGRDTAGGSMASGLYFSRVEMGGKVLSDKMLLLK